MSKPTKHHNTFVAKPLGLLGWQVSINGCDEKHYAEDSAEVILLHQKYMDAPTLKPWDGTPIKKVIKQIILAPGSKAKNPIAPAQTVMGQPAVIPPPVPAPETPPTS